MPVSIARAVDIPATVAYYRYFAGWADKIQGKTIPIGGDYFSRSQHAEAFPSQYYPRGSLYLQRSVRC
jgi:hypothetical protein